VRLLRLLPIYHLWNHMPFAPTYSDEGLPAFEELFLYACPKFISANPPPYEDQEQLAAYAEDPPPEPAQHHLALFLADVRAQAAVPTLRSFLKLYTSLDAAKLAGFLDADEEEMVQQMMAVKAASRSVSRVGNEQNLLDGQMISTSDMDFVINEVTFLCSPLRRWN
jgi:translation initiation factor 3 subunit L